MLNQFIVKIICRLSLIKIASVSFIHHPFSSSLLPVSRWCWCGPAATPSRRDTSCSPRPPCSSGRAACCRSAWTSPSCSRFTTTAATRRNRCPTPSPTPPVPKPSESLRQLPEDVSTLRSTREEALFRGAVDMNKHTRVPKHLETMQAAHSHLQVYIKTHTHTHP